MENFTLDAGRLELSLRSGATITSALVEARQIASQLDVFVGFIFSGIQVYVHGDSDIGEIEESVLEML